MADYIVCHKKRNAPRIHVRVCQEKCPFKSSCREYLTYAKPHLSMKTLHLHKETPSSAVNAPS